ncbi:MAG: hypothetical protein ACI9J3_002193 [Parvicellaceae bacterium]|jgi:hypothetical protein
MKNLFLYSSLALATLIFAPTNSFSQDGKKSQVLAIAELKNDDSQSAEFKQNYAKGARYYNLAIEQLMSVKPEANEEETKKIQPKTLELFKYALPYFQTCEKLKPGNEQVKTGIDGCKFALEIPSKTK